MKQNLHTHSIYCDGKDHPKEMAKAANTAGYDVFGFSGHGFSPLDDVSMGPEQEAQYRNEINQLKAEYQGKMDIFLGIEEDLTGKRFDKKDYDFIIGSVHFVPMPNGGYKAIDYSPEQFEKIVQEFGSFQRLAEAYYGEVKKLADRPEVDIVGHVDLLMKYNEGEKYGKFDNEDYLNTAKEAIDALTAKNKIFELNTGAMSRGYRSEPYPDKHLLQYLKEKGAKIMINADCHNRDNLELGRKKAVDNAKKAGFTTEMILTKDGFVEREMD